MLLPYSEAILSLLGLRRRRNGRKLHQFIISAIDAARDCSLSRLVWAYLLHRNTRSEVTKPFDLDTSWYLTWFKQGWVVGRLVFHRSIKNSIRLSSWIPIQSARVTFSYVFWRAVVLSINLGMKNGSVIKRNYAMVASSENWEEIMEQLINLCCISSRRK